jgi:hypothetical protein
LNPLRVPPESRLLHKRLHDRHQREGAAVALESGVV